MLIILDGFGEAPAGPGNAISASKMPFFNSLKKKYPTAFLKTDGNASGLPEGQTGASEPGHFVIGAGRIVWQPLEEVNRSFKHKGILKNKIFAHFLKSIKNKNIHLMGMVSDGGVHSHINHLLELLEILSKKEANNIFLHAFADGRDVHERSIREYLEIVKKQNKCKIASLIGRYYAMDRDKNWDRIKIAYDLLTEGKGEKICFDDLKQKIYKNAETDYYLPSFKFPEFKKIEKDDYVIFFNFRSDRAAELTQAFCDEQFDYFERKFFFQKENMQFINFGPYDLGNAWNIFPPPIIENNLGSWWSKNNIRQLRIAETEKYAHVTFFFNSQNKKPYTLEDRILINSPKVANYAEKPEMSAEAVTKRVCKEIKDDKYEAIVLNFANADLVGHSSNFNAAKKACEFLDKCLKSIVPLAIKKRFSLIITADHGNSDDMLYEDGSLRPSHSNNPVPCVFITDKEVINLHQRIITVSDNGTNIHGQLSDIAPTILDIMELPIPKEMTGKSFVKN